MSFIVYKNKKRVNAPRIDFLIKSIKTTESYKRDLEIFKIYSSNDNFISGVKELFSDPEVRKKIVGKDFPCDINSLFTGELGFIGQIEREIIWNSYEIFSYSEKINRFIELKDEFTIEVLKGNYSNAKNRLNEIEHELGLSFWLLENRFALIGYTESHEVLRKYEEELINAVDNNPIFVGMIKNLVHKSTIESSNILLGKFTNSLIRTVEELGRKHAIDYFKFKLDHYNYSGTGYASIIVWERLMPIVDRYETFVKICQRLCFDCEKNVFKYVVRAINNIKTKIRDYRLQNIGLNFNEAADQYSQHQNIYDVIEKYTTGDFSTSAVMLEKFVNENPDAFNLWEMLAKAKVQSGKQDRIGDTPYAHIISWMVDVLSLGDRFVESSEKLRNITRIFSSLSFTTEINEFLYRNYKYCDDRSMDFYVKTTDLNSKFLTPRFAFGTSNSPFKNHMIINCPVSSELMKHIYDGEDEMLKEMSLPLVRKHKSLMTVLMSKGDFLGASKCCCLLLKDNIRIYKVMALRNLINCLYKTGDFAECIEVMVENILEMPSLINSLQVDMILDCIEDGKITIDDDNLKALILYDCYSKSISSSRNDKISDMFDRFIDVNGYDSPVDIITQEKYDKNEVKYFLRHICITDNLDVLDVYTKSDEVYTERVKICEKLRSYDPQNRTEYDSMIDEIITKMIVESAMSSVDGGRIYIDIDGLKRTVRTTFAANFNSLKIEFGSGHVTQDSEVFTTVDSGSDDTRVITPQSSFGRRLFSLYKELYKEFKENTEYGLDCSLGTDIRHGHLSNQIRPILDKYKLIFQKSSDGKYMSNKYWHDKYTVVSAQLAKEVDTAIVELSKGIDKLIEDMKVDWFNVSGKNFPSVVLSDELFIKIQRKFNAIEQSDEYLNYLILTILEISDTALSSFKRDFTAFYAGQINVIFSSVFKIIENNSDRLTGLLDELLVCKNELFESGDEISNWIGLSSILDPPNFQVSVPIAHSIDVFKKLYMHSHINFNTNLECDIEFKGRHLRSFVRIFIILIENAIKHSGLNSFNLDLGVKYNGGKLLIYANNRLSSTVNTIQLKECIADIIDNIHNKNYLNISTYDKRSGIYKIARILHSNICCDNNINICFQDAQFKIKIELDCSEVIA